ncbi:hypothetical protein [Pseudomonas oryzihabitans]|uniref:hypothetical protein n=1 Tax=Pseudomonas oryzihabitans TaxID=47885 RepID=UPI0028946135|nr:hypothetical protein [Pseudomonas oryzihabitans]MDT3718468.1 hypothetical protein [Pseudomonas oryzihabitans]
MNTPTREEAISAEISSYEAMLARKVEIRKALDVAISELTQAYTNIVGAKQIFEEVKRENIEELRLYRQTIRREASEIAQASNEIRNALKGSTIADLREFVSLCERMSALKEKGFKFPATE